MFLINSIIKLIFRDITSDLEGEGKTKEGLGSNASPTNLVEDAKSQDNIMSICLEQSALLSSSVTASEPDLLNTGSSVSEEKGRQDVLSASSPPQNVTKLVLTNPLTSTSCSSTPVLQKVSTTSVITVVNTTGPLTIFKTLCSNPCVTSASQFTLVNSPPLNICNAVGKPITVVGAPPITVVRAISNVNPAIIQTTEESTKTTDTISTSVVNGSLPSSERLPMHNVFVKNTSDPPVLIPTSEIEQVQKIVPAFIQNNNVVQTTSTVMKSGNRNKTPISNNKLKIISNVLVSTSTNVSSSTSNTATNSTVILSKCTAPKHVQQKVMNSSINGTQKCVNRNPSVSKKILKATAFNKNSLTNKTPKLTYPTHKSQIRNTPLMNNSASKTGIKTLCPQSRGICNQQVHRTGSGIRTIPPQRSLKIQNKPNYIGKHAIQAQKFKTPHGIGKQKIGKSPIPAVNNIFPPRTSQNTTLTYHQALTANILQSLSENNSYNSSSKGAYEFSPKNEESRSSRYNDAYIPPPPKPQSNLETLSLVCRAVLLDHNYNATLPTESPTRCTTSTTSSIQVNGTPVGTYYSSNNNTRNRTSLGGSSNSLCTLSSLSSSSLLPSNTSSGIAQDDDAASDISCGSERKVESEETDTAPEAEAVTNEDTFGDYVTRCICDFLHDDGFMIECDKCKVWQHVRCVIKQNKKVPDDYLCEICDPSKPVDKAKARNLQQQWMRENQEREVKLRKEARMRELKLKETLSDTDSSDEEQVQNNILNKNRFSVGGKRKNDQGVRQNPRQRRENRPDNVIKRNPKRKERKLPKKKLKPLPSQSRKSDDETPATWSHPPVSQVPQLRQWIEKYEEAVTNHYSPELRARIQNIRINGIHSDLTAQIHNSVRRCRVFVQPLTSLKYLVSTINLAPNTPIIELRGKYMLSTQHRGTSAGHTGTLTTRQHSQRPGPFLFFYRLHKDNTEVCVDTRTYGNDARFVRRSCKPNAELCHCIEKGVLHLYLVTTNTVEKNLELTIKHESHDLAAVGTTHIACACGNSDECTVNKSLSLKRNGENTDVGATLRKRRGRRTISLTSEHEPSVIIAQKVKDEPSLLSVVEVKPEIEVKEESDVKQDLKEINVEECLKPMKVEIKEVEDCFSTKPENETKVKEEEVNSLSPPMCLGIPKKSSFNPKSDTEDKKEQSPKENSNISVDKRKLSREERKIEAYMKAFERMERQQQRKQEHQAKQAHRRESEPGPLSKDDEKLEPKVKRRRRKGRSRTISTNSQARRNRLNSADSSYATSGDECMLSPNDSQTVTSNKDVTCDNSPNKDAGSLLALVHCENSNRCEMKSPIPDVDCNSNSANSSPETPLSSACLLVAAAVEPLEPSFKFPKTKKVLMNEWLNKSPECIQSASSISPSSLTPHIVAPPSENHFYDTNSNSSFYMPSKSLVSLSQNLSYCELPSQTLGNAKKRWLRQAISEDQCDSPTGRVESPPLAEMVAPPKKRRLPRESISAETSPPLTPTNINASMSIRGDDEEKRFHDQEDRVEIVTPDGDSPTQIIDDATLKDRVAEMRQEIGGCFRLPETRDASLKDESLQQSSLRCVLDPRLARPVFNSSDHLVATVEKNLSILGLEDQKLGNIVPPTKRKLSITEYRQRKQLTVSEKIVEERVIEDSTLSPLHKLRTRSDSASSSTSFMSSDDEIQTPDLSGKGLSAFNSEPTELEKQRESFGLRFKKTFGLSIDEDSNKTALNMETLLSNDLGASSLKSSAVQPFSPAFPISSNCNLVSLSTTSSQLSPADEASCETPKPKEEVEEHLPTLQPLVNKSIDTDSSVEMPKENDDVKSEMFYTLDEEEKVEEKPERKDTEKQCDKFDVENANYIPPFNNPVYPNSSFTTFGSVMDDDAPYEGRNPSPPPELSSAPGSYSPH